MDFLILRPLSPKTGYHFLGGGGGGVGGGGGQKFLLNRLQAVGKLSATASPLVQWYRGQRTARSRWFESWSTDFCGGAAASSHRTRVRTADTRACGRMHYHSATTDSGNQHRPDCFIKCLLLTKNPKCVFLSDRLLACLTD